MDFIINIDHTIFHFINSTLSNSFCDVFLKWVRNAWIWLPLYAFTISFCIMNFRKNAYWFILCMLLCSTTADILSSHVIKKTVKRKRPCRDKTVKEINLVVDRCSSGFSFTSSHAANHFSFAIFISSTLGLRFRRIKMPLFIWASLICFAQVYVGVHFPFDVLCGALLGSIIAVLWSKIYHSQFNPESALDFVMKGNMTK